LHGHLVVTWFAFVVSRTIAQKKARVGCKEVLKKHNSGVSKEVYKIVTGGES